MGSGIGKASFEGEVDIDQTFVALERHYIKAKTKGLVDSPEAMVLQEAYKKAKEAYEGFKVGNTTTVELVELVNHLHEKYESYKFDENFVDIQVGDIVQVKDSDINLWVQAMVTQVNVQEGLIDVVFQEYGDMAASIQNDISVKEVRKVQNWDFLEVGDRVKVAEGALKFEGIISKLNLDGTIDVLFTPFNGLDNEEDNADPAGKDLEDDPEYEREVELIETHPREKITKISSRLLPSRNWKIAKKVLQQMRTTTAFREILMENHAQDQEEKISE